MRYMEFDQAVRGTVEPERKHVTSASPPRAARMQKALILMLYSFAEAHSQKGHGQKRDELYKW